jgi:hypothetical protein
MWLISKTKENKFNVICYKMCENNGVHILLFLNDFSF